MGPTCSQSISQSKLQNGGQLEWSRNYSVGIAGGDRVKLFVRKKKSSKLINIKTVILAGIVAQQAKLLLGIPASSECLGLSPASRPSQLPVNKHPGRQCVISQGLSPTHPRGRPRWISRLQASA